MRTNRNKAISHYQKEANLLRNEYDDYDEEEQDTSEIPHNDDAVRIATNPVESGAGQAASGANEESTTQAPTMPDATSAPTANEQAAEAAEGAKPHEAEEGTEGAESGAPAICPHVLSVYETVMLIQLKRMIKRNTKAFAVMLKILIQGDPKRKP